MVWTLSVDPFRKQLPGSGRCALGETLFCLLWGWAGTIFHVDGREGCNKMVHPSSKSCSYATVAKNITKSHHKLGLTATSWRGYSTTNPPFAPFLMSFPVRHIPVHPWCSHSAIWKMGEWLEAFDDCRILFFKLQSKRPALLYGTFSFVIIKFAIPA